MLAVMRLHERSIDGIPCLRVYNSLLSANQCVTMIILPYVFSNKCGLAVEIFFSFGDRSNFQRGGGCIDVVAMQKYARMISVPVKK